MKNKKAKKVSTIQVRCTQKELKQIDSLAAEYGITRSGCIRKILFSGMGSVTFMVRAQEFLNCLREKYGAVDKTAEKEIDGLWESLL